MEKMQTLEEFYKSKFDWLPENLQQDIGHFNVFRMEDCIGPGKTPVQYSRRDFYKVSLVRGRTRYHYADKSIEISGSTLMFFNPQVPYNWEPLSDDRTGFFCIFKEAFFTETLRGNIHDLPMFMPGGKPGYVLSEEGDREVSAIFEKMLTEIGSDYRFKFDLLRNYVTEMIHYALKLAPSERSEEH